MLEEHKSKLEMKNNCITDEKETQGRKHAAEQAMSKPAGSKGSRDGVAWAKGPEPS